MIDDFGSMRIQIKSCGFLVLRETNDFEFVLRLRRETRLKYER